MPRSCLLFGVFVLALAQAGCSGCSVDRHPHSGTDTGPSNLDANIVPGQDTGVPPTDTGPNMVSDSGFMRSCAADSIDTEGCACTAGGAPRACWPYMAALANRGMGLCMDGTQTCVSSGTEFSNWGPCTGATLPVAENCTNGVDDNCEGQIDCADATCASDPACNLVRCPEFGTRPCYDGPPASQNVGACHDGTQTCTGGVWGSCVGEQTPQREDCSIPRDLNCNHLPGCFDLFVCAASPACQEHCASPLMAGCECPMGQGDVATCRAGMHAITTGTIGGTIQCCPCRASDCGEPNCCSQSVCGGASACRQFTCNPLPSTCMGRVNADCDDFPEDCDEPCCACYGSCSGP